MIRQITCPALLVSLVLFGGCHGIQRHPNASPTVSGHKHGGGLLSQKHPKRPPIEISPDTPRELCKAMVPDYVIEPPDVLTIEALRLLPKQPYAMQPLDSLAVQISQSTGEPIFSATAAIDPSGQLPLGPEFRSVEAEGKTIEEIRADIEDLVAQTYANAMVSVDIVQIEQLQQVAGQHMVGPDGKINLGVYGKVRVAGMTIEQATEVVREQLALYLDEPKVSIDVFGFNSKYYYVIFEGGGLGDQVARFPHTGNETVLDALSNVDGLQAVSSKQMWVARPGRNDSGGDQIMPVDWEAVAMRGDPRTNYQLLPGDRLFVAEDGLVAVDNRLAKTLAPLERVAGVTVLITNAVQRLVFFDQGGRGGIGGGGFGGGGF